MSEGAAKGLVLASSNLAAAYAVRDLDVDVIAVYPITPQTSIVEALSEMIARGELDAELIHVESEHSALSAVVGAAAAGARVFTATSSQGLELMHEVLHIASGLRLPVVMAVPTRALSAPISIWGDYSDLMNTRDSSWVTIIASTAQEVYDSMIQAYMIAEDERVMLPVMVAYDGFLMSHTYEPMNPPLGRERALRLAPKRVRKLRLDPEHPITMGTIVGPEWYYEIKYQQVEAMREVFRVLEEANKALMRETGRSYGTVEAYKTEDADVIVVTYGGLFGTLMEAVDSMRERGLRVGGLRVRLWRPFPADDVVNALAHAKVVAVVDRAISYGARVSGPLALEVMAALYDQELRPRVVSFVAGIGQRHVGVEDFVGMARLALERAREVRGVPETIYWGVRGARA